MAVPKTAMDENHFGSANENQIRLPRQIAPVEAVTISHAIDKTSYEHLGSSVLASDPAHQAAALSDGQLVHGLIARIITPRNPLKVKSSGGQPPFRGCFRKLLCSLVKPCAI
jgi:hypothetical protein